MFWCVATVGELGIFTGKKKIVIGGEENIEQRGFCERKSSID